MISSITHPIVRPVIRETYGAGGVLDIVDGKQLVISQGAKETNRPIQPGYALSFDGVDDYISAPHLVGTETVVSYHGTSSPSISAGRIDFTAGTCSNLVLSDGTQYNLEESTGINVFDSSGGGNHATLINGVSWVADPTKPYDYANQEGFTVGTGSNGAAVGVIIPKVEGTNLDVFGNELDYTEAVFPVQPVKRGSYCGFFDGVDDYIRITNFNPTGNGFIEAIFSPQNVSGNVNYQYIVGARDSIDTRLYLSIQGANGDALVAGFGSQFITGSTQLVSGQWYTARMEWDGSLVKLYLDGVLEVSAPQVGVFGSLYDMHIGVLNDAGTNKDYYSGEIAYLNINDQAVFTFSEGYGFRVYDTSGNENHGTVINASTSVQGAGFWAGRQDVYHHNLDHGFSLPVKLTANTSVGSYGSKAIADQVFTGDFEISFLVPETNNGVKTAGIYYGSPPPGSFSPSVTNTPSFQFFSTFNQIWNNGSIQDGNQTVGVGTVLGIKRVGSTVTMIKSGTVQETFFNEPTDDVYFYVAFDDVDRTLEDFRSTQGYLSFSGTEGMDVTTPKRLPADFNGLDPFSLPATNPSILPNNNGAETLLDCYNVAVGDVPAPETNHLSNFSAVSFTDDKTTLANTSPANTVLRSDFSASEKGPLTAYNEQLTQSEYEAVSDYNNQLI